MSVPKLGLVVASDPLGNIGFKNTIPWRLPGDLKHFREITMGNVVIMGRNTYNSLAGPLEGRVNIVVTSQPLTMTGDADVYVVSSIDDAIETGKRFNPEWIYFIGGAAIYEEAMKIVEAAYVTLVHLEDGVYDTQIIDFKFPEDKWMLTDCIHAPFKIDPETGFGKHTHTYCKFVRKQVGA